MNAKFSMKTFHKVSRARLPGRAVEAFRLARALAGCRPVGLAEAKRAFELLRRGCAFSNGSLWHGRWLWTVTASGTTVPEGNTEFRWHAGDSPALPA